MTKSKEARRLSALRSKQSLDSLRAQKKELAKKLNLAASMMKIRDQELTRQREELAKGLEELATADNRRQETQSKLDLSLASLLDLSKGFEDALAAANKENKRLARSVKSLQNRLSETHLMARRNYKRFLRAKQMKDQYKRVIGRARMALKLTERGVYTPGFQSLIRSVIQLGCPARKTGRVLYCILRYVSEWISKPRGVKEVRRVSARTVRRVVLEGGVAADIQTGYEMNMAPGK